MNKITTILLLGVIALVGGLYFRNSIVNYSTNVQGVSSPGATNSSAKEYTVTMAPATLSATSTSLLNTDGTDREIISSVTACTSVGNSFTSVTGAGLANWIVQMSTSTSNGGGLQGNNNFASNITISTSSPWVFVASSTETFPTYVARVWPTNTYLNILFNATNTAACTVGVRTLSL